MRVVVVFGGRRRPAASFACSNQLMAENFFFAHPFVFVYFEAFSEKVLAGFGHRAVGAEPERLAVDATQKLLFGAAGPGGIPVQELVVEHAYCEDIAAKGVLGLLEALGRHIHGGSHVQSSQVAVVSADCKAEVSQLESSVSC